MKDHKMYFPCAISLIKLCLDFVDQHFDPYMCTLSTRESILPYQILNNLSHIIILL